MQCNQLWIKRMVKFMCLLVSVSLFSACSNQHTSPQAWLKKTDKVTLPSAQLPLAIHEQQLLNITFKGRTDSLLTLLDADGKMITLIGLSPLGIRLFKIAYLGDKIHVTQNFDIKGLPAANQILLDIMLSYWPIDAWQNRLPNRWNLVDTGMKRILYDEKGVKVVEIQYEEKYMGNEKITRNKSPRLLSQPSVKASIRPQTDIKFNEPERMRVPTALSQNVFGYTIQIKNLNQNNQDNQNNQNNSSNKNVNNQWYNKNLKQRGNP